MAPQRHTPGAQDGEDGQLRLDLLGISSPEKPSGDGKEDGGGDQAEPRLRFVRHSKGEEYV